MSQLGAIFMAIGLALLLFLPNFRSRTMRMASQVGSAAVFGAGTIGFVMGVMTPPV